MEDTISIERTYCAVFKVHCSFNRQKHVVFRCFSFRSRFSSAFLVDSNFIFLQVLLLGHILMARGCESVLYICRTEDNFNFINDSHPFWDKRAKCTSYSRHFLLLMLPASEVEWCTWYDSVWQYDSGLDLQLGWQFNKHFTAKRNYPECKRCSAVSTRLH